MQLKTEINNRSSRNSKAVRREHTLGQLYLLLLRTVKHITIL